MPWPKIRTSEWVLISFFTYTAVLSIWLPGRAHPRYMALLVCLAVLALLFIVPRLNDVYRDWLPLLLTLIAFREMELFLPARFPHSYEPMWMEWDRLILENWHVRAAIESFNNVVPFFLEFCYLFVYALGPYCIAVLFTQHRRDAVDRFYTVYLLGTLTAYALFPYFPSEPPRLVYPGIDTPGVHTWVRDLNLYILSKATIHVGVFPSAHVSSAFSAAWGMFLVLPRRKIFGWTLLAYAVAVSIATVYGRYHYAADVVAGLGVSVLSVACATISIIPVQR